METNPTTEVEYGECVGCGEELPLDDMTVVVTFRGSYDEPTEYGEVCDACEDPY